MPLFFAVTLFISAFLLFLVQPLVGKMLLPLMGGTPVVWNTCMVFFQAMLLGGYLYSHATTNYFDVRRQTVVHLGLLALTLLALGTAAAVMGQPIAVSASLSPQGDRIPVFGMMLVLFLAVGLPFFTVATSAPLLQRWFASTGHKSAKDPYFLYGASNLGSVLAMLAYPMLLEPKLPLAEQSWVWTAGFLALAVLIATCGWFVWKSPMTPQLGATGSGAKRPVAAPAPPITWPQRLRWLALAFVPSSLMLGVTTYLVTDIASIPLLWIIPLGLYLITFIVAFPPLPGGTQLPKMFHTALALVTPVFILLLIFVLLTHIMKDNIVVMLLLHLATFLAVALTCHTELARSRPSAERLTEFFLVISLGGVLGGLFNALIAPLIFNGVHEYQVTLACACLMLPALSEKQADGKTYVIDFAVIGGMFLLVWFLAMQSYKAPHETWSQSIAFWRRPVSEIAEALANGVNWSAAKIGASWSVSAVSMFQVIGYGVPLLLCYVFVERPLRFGLCVATLLLVVHFNDSRSDIILQKRSFFGVLKITETKQFDGEDLVVYHELVHGTTVHGFQIVEAPVENWDWVTTPLSYYHKTGPIGDLFGQFSGPTMKKEMAVIGLGTGTTAAYGEKGQHITYYEIDPLVRRIATNPEYFSYLTNCKATWEIIMGDARVQLERNKNAKYGMIIVDAFSSDSIPIHLLTKQAIELYLDRLEPDGVLVLHISNRYLRLKPVVAKLAESLKLTALLRDDSDNSAINKSGSNWVAVALQPEQLGQLPNLANLPEFQDDYFDELIPQPGRRFALGAVGGGMVPLKTRDRWVLMKAKPEDPLWTDDFSNLLRIMNWR